MSALPVDPWSAMRGSLDRFIWRGGMPTGTGTVALNTGLGYGALGDPNCPSVDTLTLPLDGLGNYTVIDVVHPRTPNGIAVIMHAGHSVDYFSGSTPLPVLYQQMVAALLGSGYTVLGCTMPFIGRNPDIQLNGLVLATHQSFALYDALAAPTDPSSLVYFLTGPVMAVNYMVAQGFKTFYAIGHSGGGWTVDFLGALDTRITKVYSVFGSLPFALRTLSNASGGSATGDYEQLIVPCPAAPLRNWWTQTRLNSLEENLYTLGCRNPGQRRVQILGTLEPDFRVGAITAQVSAYVAAISAIVPPGQCRVLFDTTTTVHQISPWANAQIIADMAAP